MKIYKNVARQILALSKILSDNCDPNSGDGCRLGEAVGLVQALKDKIKELNESVDSAKNIGELRSFQKQLESTKQQLDRLLEPLQKEIDIGDTLTDKLSEKFNLFDTEPLKIGSNVTLDTEKLDAVSERIKNYLAGYKFQFQETAQQVEIELNSIAGQVTSSFAEIIGASLGDPGQDFGKNILKAAAGFAKQFGEILIAAGFAAKAAKKLIVDPTTAIVAGVALVAIGSAVQAAASKSAKSAFGGGGGGGGSEGQLQTPNRVFEAAGNTIELTGSVELKAAGSEIQGALNSNNFKRGRTG